LNLIDTFVCQAYLRGLHRLKVCPPSALIASFLAHEEQFGLNSEGADIRSQNVLTFHGISISSMISMRIHEALQEEGQRQSGWACRFQAVSVLDDRGNCCGLFGVARKGNLYDCT